MPDTYNIKEAQTGLPRLCRSGKRFVIANRNTPVMVAMPVDDFEALMETLDVGDPAAMDALGLALSGKGTYRKLNLDDPDFGLCAGGRLAHRPAAADQAPRPPLAPRTVPRQGRYQGPARTTRGFCRLRVRGMRIIYRQVSTREIHLDYAHTRDVVYEIFERLLQNLEKP